MLDPLELSVGAHLVEGKENCELVPAETKRFRATGRTEHLADQHQYVVTGGVPEDIVDVLEVVHVCKAERKGLPAALRLADALTKHGLIGAVVAEAG